MRDDWQLIATAPKDGRLILAFGDGDFFIAWWSGDSKHPAEWVSNDYHANTMDDVGQPTHWQPLEPPQ